MQLPVGCSYISGEIDMKKMSAFSVWSIFGIAVGYFAIFRLLSTADETKLSALTLQAVFPTRTGLIVIWAILFLLWIVGSCFVYSVRLSPRRKRNIFLNSMILLAGIFVWNFMIFSSCNLTGALAVCISILLLGIVVWFMYLVSHRYGGYLFTSMMVWLLFLLYLSIALVVKN